MGKCPKCDGRMERGKLTEVSGGLRFISDQEGKKIVGKSTRAIAYRCLECGYCEIYAKGQSR